MLKIGLTIIGLVILVIVVFGLWCCCVVSGRNSRYEESIEFQHRISDLSDLEKQAVDNIVSGLNDNVSVD